MEDHLLPRSNTASESKQLPSEVKITKKRINLNGKNLVNAYLTPNYSILQRVDTLSKLK